MSEPWWLYPIECEGGGIYVGIAKNVEARYQQHTLGKGALYTKLRRPVRLLGFQEYPSHKLAPQAELKMKKLDPAEKWRWGHVLSGGFKSSGDVE